MGSTTNLNWWVYRISVSNSSTCITLLGTNISPTVRHFWVDDFPFPQVGYVSSLESIITFFCFVWKDTVSVFFVLCWCFLFFILYDTSMKPNGHHLLDFIRLHQGDRLSSWNPSKLAFETPIFCGLSEQVGRCCPWMPFARCLLFSLWVGKWWCFFWDPCKIYTPENEQISWTSMVGRCRKPIERVPVF